MVVWDVIPGGVVILSGGHGEYCIDLVHGHNYGM